MKYSKQDLIQSILESIQGLKNENHHKNHDHENNFHGETKKKFHGKNLIFGSNNDENKGTNILELDATLDETDEAVCEGCLVSYMNEHVGILEEAKYKGRKVPLGKPMRGDVKKSKVFVKDPKTGNVKKVNFGDPNMTIKKNIPARRKSFRARHKCSQKKDRTTPGFWSCRAWE